MHNSATQAISGTLPVAAAKGYQGKRLFDAVGALVLILLASPLMLLACVMVLLTSPGPIIFRQKRVWMGGKQLFTVWKFRTMYVGSERPHDLVKDGDNRVAPGGCLLRKTHIDELPQLFQVLRGTMSLVGPRPDTPEKAEKRVRANPKHRELQQWKPGLVGRVCLMGKWEELQQKNSSFDATEVELKYLNHASCLTDLRLLGLTALKVAGISVNRWLL